MLRCKLLEGEISWDLKQEILKLLEENREQYLSGQEIANRLSFSRTAVWKSIKALKEDGYEIDAISNKGYRLDTTCDLLSAEGIRCYLSSDYHNVPIEVHQQIDSTNTEAKKQAMNGAPHGDCDISRRANSWTWTFRKNVLFS